jgi:SulP family sulfate permease
LRGRASLGATIVDVLAHYAERLRDAGGRLYLTGLSEDTRTQLLRDQRFQAAAGVETYEATSVRGASTRAAFTDAEAWLVTTRDAPPPDSPH